MWRIPETVVVGQGLRLPTMQGGVKQNKRSGLANLGQERFAAGASDQPLANGAQSFERIDLV